jgi:Zn-dependent protease with chaperone function
MSFDFDFLRYVERRKGARAQESREGAAYAYSGDLKVLRTLDRLKPVKLAVEGTVRLWRSSARAELLGPAVKATERQQPRVHAAAQRCAAALHIAPPTVYVTPGQLGKADGGLTAYTFGTDDDPTILLHASLVEALTDLELAFSVGRECGHLQNDHALYRTALYFLSHSAGTFVRWIVSPAAAALGSWAKRAELTADRAGLICCRDLEASTLALIKGALGPSILQGTTPDEARHANPPVDARARALALFAESAYYTGLSGPATGPSATECDAKVAELLR